MVGCASWPAWLGWAAGYVGLGELVRMASLAAVGNQDTAEHAEALQQALLSPSKRLAPLEKCLAKFKLLDEGRYEYMYGDL